MAHPATAPATPRHPPPVATAPGRPDRLVTAMAVLPIAAVVSVGLVLSGGA